MSSQKTEIVPLINIPPILKEYPYIPDYSRLKGVYFRQEYLRGIDYDAERDNNIPTKDKFKSTISEAQSMLTTTYSGFNLDEVKSAYQKAVRRGYSFDALHWVLEMAFTGKQVETNAWNRTMIMTVEDIGPANPMAFIHVLNLSEHRREFKLGKESYHAERFMAISIAALYIAQSAKSRVNDWACHLYRSLKDPKVADNTILFHGGLNSVCQKLVTSLFEKHPEEAIYWVKCLLGTSFRVKDGTKRGYNAKKLITKVMTVVFMVKNKPNNYAYEVLLYASKRSKDKAGLGEVILFYVHLIHLWCSGQLDDLANIENPGIKGYLKDTGSLAGLIIEFSLRTYHLPNLGIPLYAIDMHTSRGSRNPDKLRQFIEEGAFLNDEVTIWSLASEFYLDHSGLLKAIKQKNDKS